MSIHNAQHQRKSIRLKHFDYGQTGYYFITVCTEGKKSTLGTIVDDHFTFSPFGESVADWIECFKNKDDGITIIESVIMPNHVHLIVEIRPESQLTLFDFMQQFKSVSTLDYIKKVQSGEMPLFKKRIWHRNYYEHIIRNQSDYDAIWTYMQNNVLKWSLDRNYTP